MNICVDVGNSTVTFGEYENNVLINKVQMNYDFRSSESFFLDVLIKNLESANKIDEVEGIFYSSVVPEVDVALKGALSSLYNLEVKTYTYRKSKAGFKFDIDNPKETGGDLVADLAGAYKKYGYPLLIVDLGTASKILYFDKKGRFASANILPGIKLCRNSLNKNTSLLPHIDLSIPKTVIGKNTIDAMNTGLVLGHVDMIEGMIKRYKDELKMDLKVVVTGGQMNLLKDAMNPAYIYDDNLTLDGINVLYNLNK